jgi:hypothetical protein
MTTPEHTVSKSAGLTCPQCTHVIPVAEGERIVRCPTCDTRSLVQGDRGVRRWQVLRDIDRGEAVETVHKFWRGWKKANDLKRTAEIQEAFLVYLPYWYATAFVSGWTFGRRKSGEKSTKPVEVRFEQDLFWNDAAVDVSEFGVHRVPIPQSKLEPYESERLHAEGMVFEPSESRTEAMKEATDIFKWRGQERNLTSRYFEKFHYIRQRLSLVYYPLWIARYAYKGRQYQVVVDGKKGGVLYGKAPGNILYRAVMLVVGMALGNFILVNGTILAFLAVGNSTNDESLAFLLIPLGLGLALIAFAYNAFRHGEEVEEGDRAAKKDTGGGDAFKYRDIVTSGLKMLEDL